MDIIRFVAGCCILFFLNDKLTFISLGIIPFLILGIANSRSDVKRINEKILEENARLEKELSDTFQGIETLKSFSKEEKGLERTVKALSEFYEIESKQNSIFSKYRNSIELIVYFGEVLILYFGIREIIYGNLSIGGFIAFQGYTLYLYSPIRNFSFLNIHLDYAKRSFQRIHELLNIIPENGGNEKIKTVQSIEARNLRFSYDGNNEIIRNLNFRIEKGDKVLILGKSGSGKSTLIKLILGLYTPQEGQILYNEINLNMIDKKNLREKIGYVSQNIFLFAGTLRENILMGRNDLPEEKLERILTDCKLKDIIERKKEGNNISFDDLKIYEKGLNFSGGERQLIALARALVKDPEVIILNEAGANIDIETENEIERLILKKFKDRVIIKISHRIQRDEEWKIIRLESK